MRRRSFLVGIMLILMPVIITAVAAFLSYNRLVSQEFVPNGELLMLSVYVFVPVGFIFILSAIAANQNRSQRKYLWLYVILGPLGILLYLMHRDQTAGTSEKTPAECAVSPTPLAAEPRFIPTPLGFVSGILMTLAASLVAAVCVGSARHAPGMLWLANISKAAPFSTACLVLIGLAGRRIWYPNESARSIGAWGSAWASILVTVFLAIALRSNWPVAWEIIAGAGLLWLALIAGTIFTIRQALNERDDADYLVAESCKSAASSYLLLGTAVIGLALGWLFLVLQNVVSMNSVFIDFAPQICATAVALGSVFLLIGVVLSRRATGTPGGSGSPLASYLLLGPLGLVLWLSHRDQQVKRELQQLRDGSAEPSAPPVKIQAESSSGTMGRYFSQFGTILVCLPLVHAFTLQLLGLFDPDVRTQEVILSLSVGVLAVAIGIGIRTFKDDEPQHQRPLRLWRIPLTLILFAGIVGAASAIDQTKRLNETRSFATTLVPVPDFPEIQYVLVDGMPTRTLRSGKLIQVLGDGPAGPDGRSTVTVVTRDGRELKEQFPSEIDGLYPLKTRLLESGRLAKVSIKPDATLPLIQASFDSVGYSVRFPAFECYLPIGSSQRISVTFGDKDDPETLTTTRNITDTNPITLSLSELIDSRGEPPAPPDPTMESTAVGERISPVDTAGSDNGTSAPNGDAAQRRSDRLGELTIDIRDDGMKVAMRRLSAFGGAIGGSEQQVTRVGESKLKLTPGDYELIIHDLQFGWQNAVGLQQNPRQRRLSVKEGTSETFVVERKLSELGRGSSGYFFYWNGKKSFLATHPSQVNVLDTLMSRFAEEDPAVPIAELKETYSLQRVDVASVKPPPFEDFWEENRPNCIVPGDEDGTWRLAPVPQGTLRIVLTDKWFRGDIVPVGNNSHVSPRWFVGWKEDQRELEFRLPPGKYQIKPETQSFGWKSYRAGVIGAELDPLEPVVVEVKDNATEHVEFAPDLKRLASFSRDEHGAKNDKYVVLRWNAGKDFPLTRDEEAVVKVLLANLANGGGDLDQTTLATLADVDPDSLNQFLTKTTAARADGSRVDLIVPGEVKGTWRMAPLEN